MSCFAHDRQVRLPPEEIEYLLKYFQQFTPKLLMTIDGQECPFDATCLQPWGFIGSGIDATAT